jgi:site-specific DNA recombinase
MTIGYIRVSTEKQADFGVSLEMQEKKIRAYCDLNDLNLTEVICDAGISGKNLSRPGIQRVLELVKAGEVSGIVIYKLDRLGRSTSDLLDIAKLIDKKGVAIHSLTEKIDTSSAIGRFFFTLTSALAEMERGLISERTIAALAEKRAKNERTNFKAQFGYEFTPDGKVIENPIEQRIIQIVVELKAQGESVRGIQKRLTADGYLNRNGKPFATSAIFYMIKKAA